MSTWFQGEWKWTSRKWRCVVPSVPLRSGFPRFGRFVVRDTFHLVFGQRHSDYIDHELRNARYRYVFNSGSNFNRSFSRPGDTHFFYRRFSLHFFRRKKMRQSFSKSPFFIPATLDAFFISPIFAKKSVCSSGRRRHAVLFAWLVWLSDKDATSFGSSSSKGS